MQTFHFRCSVDPYLFGNFATEKGDKVKANFRAFKFPETNYVLFKGILNVCIDVCEGVSATTLNYFPMALQRNNNITPLQYRTQHAGQWETLLHGTVWVETGRSLSVRASEDAAVEL